MQRALMPTNRNEVLAMGLFGNYGHWRRLKIGLSLMMTARGDYLPTSVSPPPASAYTFQIVAQDGEI